MIDRALSACVAAAVIAAAVPARAADGDRWDGATIGVQVAAGVGGAVIGGGALGVAGLLIGASSADKGDWGKPLAGAVIGLMLGGEVGVIVGVQLEGDARNGTGHAWATTVGGVVGLGGAGVSIYLGAESKLPTSAILAIAGAFALAGPIVGYHLGADDHATAVPRTVPLVAFSF